jgi:hypothetical protein
MEAAGPWTGVMQAVEGKLGRREQCAETHRARNERSQDSVQTEYGFRKAERVLLEDATNIDGQKDC